MANILQFPVPAAKLDFTRATKPRGKSRRKDATEPRDQLSLFQPHKPKILTFAVPSGGGLFEQALYSDEHDEARAEELYRKAILEGDEVADAYCNLGIIEFKKGRIPAAFDSFTLALKYDARHPESHYNLGNLYFDEGDLRLAIMHYELSLAIDPSFPNVYFNLGLALAVQKNYTAAAERLLQYIALVPHDEGTKVNELVSQLKSAEKK